jgi:surface protein
MGASTSLGVHTDTQEEKVENQEENNVHDYFKVLLSPLFRSTKLFRTDEDIKVAARARADPATRAAAEIKYGHISDWETSQVTNMEMLFCGDAYYKDANMQSFNDDISRWDTSNATTLHFMFCDAFAFNGDLSRWDTSNVTTMDVLLKPITSHPAAVNLAS